MKTTGLWQPPSGRAEELESLLVEAQVGVGGAVAVFRLPRNTAEPSLEHFFFPVVSSLDLFFPS